MDLMPQTATWTHFRVPISAILHFIRFGFSLEKKEKVLDISTMFSMDCASFKKMLYNLHMQYKGSNALIFLYLLFLDVFQ